MHINSVHSSIFKLRTSPLSISHFLTATITKPTRVTEFTGTCIDNIFINSLSGAAKSTILYDDLPDHFPILLELCNKKEKYVCLVETSRRYDQASVDHFKSLIGSHDWSVLNLKCSQMADSSSLFDYFFDIITKL